MVRISAIQMEINPLSIDENVRRIQEYMDSARGSDITCFPELSLTHQLKPTYAELESCLESIGNKSASLGMWSIIGGYAQRGGRTFNEIYVINRDGRLVHTYQKRHLWRVEEGVTPGTANRVLDTDFGKIGVINCWDIAFFDDVRTLAVSGAEIIFCPSYWYDKPKPNKTPYFGYPEARAHENQIYLVLCDAHSEETLGRSKILSPVEILAEANGECMISADIGIPKLGGLREQFDCWK